MERVARVAFRIAAESRLPVIYLTQLIGWALGLDAAVLGLDAHFVPAVRALAKEH